MERVRKVRIGAGVEGRTAAAVLQTLFAVLIVDVTLLLVREHLVRFGDLLKLLFRLRRLVLIWMVFKSQLAVGLLYFIFSRRPTDAKD